MSTTNEEEKKSTFSTTTWIIIAIVAIVIIIIIGFAIYYFYKKGKQPLTENSGFAVKAGHGLHGALSEIRKIPRNIAQGASRGFNAMPTE
jgi:flagellar basal body-associated protein FliL